MKNIYAFLFLLLSTFGYSQSLSDIKYDSIVKIENTDLSLVYSKKKTAVWHDANFFVAQPTKNYFIFLEAAELLVEVDFKHKMFYAIVQDENTGGYKRFFLANDGVEAEVVSGKSGFFLKLDSTYYNNLFTEQENYNEYNKLGKVGLRIKKNKLFITDYSFPIFKKSEKYLFPLKSISNPILDSAIFENGKLKLVYNQDTARNLISNSGVYNSKQKQWIVAPIHFSSVQYENNILYQNSFNYTKDVPTYVLYRINKNEGEIIQDNINQITPEIILSISDLDSVKQLEDNSHFITFKDNKQGLIEFQLFNEFEQKIYPYYRYNILLKPRYDLVYYSTITKIYFCKKFEFYQIYNHFDGLVMDSLIGGGSFGEGEEVEFDNIIEGQTSELYFREINDSLLIVKDFISQYIYDDILDTMIFDNVTGETTYYYSVPEPGKYYCGLYNLNQNKWIIEPNEYNIQHFGGHQILINKPVFDNNQLIKNLDNFDLYDLNGHLIQSNLTANEIATSKNLTEGLLLNKNESLTNMGYGKYSNKNLPDSLDYKTNLHYIKNGNKYKIIEIEQDYYSYNINQLSDFYDFIHLDDVFTFGMDNNQSFFKIKSDKKKDSTFFTEENYTIEILFYNQIEYNTSKKKPECTISSNGKTIFQTDFSNYNHDDPYPSKITITKNGNEIIINEDFPSQEIIFEEFDEEYGEPNGDLESWKFENENSEIWRKINNEWIKVSPNYHSILKIPFGYICKTGFYQYEKSEVWGMEILEQKHINASFILLDSTLKPIGYSDFYNFDLIEDLDFGLKICPVIDKEKWNTAEGHGNCFFVDNYSKVLCDAKYDSFEFKNGKIYGIRKEVYKIYEETGELYYEEYGDAILLQKYERVLIGEVGE